MSPTTVVFPRGRWRPLARVSMPLAHLRGQHAVAYGLMCRQGLWAAPMSTQQSAVSSAERRAPSTTPRQARIEVSASTVPSAVSSTRIHSTARRPHPVARSHQVRPRRVLTMAIGVPIGLISGLLVLALTLLGLSGYSQGVTAVPHGLQVLSVWLCWGATLTGFLYSCAPDYSLSCASWDSDFSPYKFNEASADALVVTTACAVFFTLNSSLERFNDFVGPKRCFSALALVLVVLTVKLFTGLATSMKSDTARLNVAVMGASVGTVRAAAPHTRLSTHQSATHSQHLRSRHNMFAYCRYCLRLPSLQCSSMRRPQAPTRLCVRPPFRARWGQARMSTPIPC